MSKTTVAQPRAMDLGEPQRRYVIEPRENPVPHPVQPEPILEPQPMVEEPEKVAA